MSAGIDTGTQLRAVAARLADIADAVAREAEGAAATIRDVTEQVQAAARLAGDLARAAGEVEAGVREQARAVDDAKATLADREPSILALARSIDTVSAIATAIAGIAKQSQLLALNARIEAARGGEHGAGFAVVAREMSALSQATQASTRDIGASAAAVGRDVAGAREVVTVGAELARTQDAMVASALHVAGEQRATADALTRITGGTAERIDAAATAIGRVGSNAVAVRLLARQVARIAG